MCLSLGSPTAELNKVPGNLCLRLAPWGERPASWHFPAEHITSPGSSEGSLAGGPEASGLQGQTASDRHRAAHLWIPHVAPCPHDGTLANPPHRADLRSCTQSCPGNRDGCLRMPSTVNGRTWGLFSLLPFCSSQTFGG